MPPSEPFSSNLISGMLYFLCLSMGDKLLFMGIENRINPLRPNNDLSQTSPCNIKGLSVSEVMRIDNMITQVKCY